METKRKEVRLLILRIKRKIGRKSQIIAGNWTKEINSRGIKNREGKGIIVLFKRIREIETIEAKRKRKIRGIEEDWRRKKAKIIRVLKINWGDYEEITVGNWIKENGNGFERLIEKRSKIKK